MISTSNGLLCNGIDISLLITILVNDTFENLLATSHMKLNATSLCSITVKEWKLVNSVLYGTWHYELLTIIRIRCHCTVKVC